MIDRQTDPVAWSLFMDELEDAQEHLKNLCQEVVSNNDYSEVEFKIDMAHIYAHLNRAWNGRNTTKELSQDEGIWDEFSKFPIDIEPL